MNSSAEVTLTHRGAILGSSLLSQILWVVGFSAATVLSSQAVIPHVPVPYTLQTLVVLLAGALLGPVNGAMSQILYLAAGVAGVPVFAGGTFGLFVLTGPTGGYLMGFPIAAALVGIMLEKRQGIIWVVASMASGLLVIFTCGTLYLYAFATHNFSVAVQSGFLIFTWWDLLKLGAASMIYYEIAKRWKRVPKGTDLHS